MWMPLANNYEKIIIYFFEKQLYVWKDFLFVILLLLLLLLLLLVFSRKIKVYFVNLF